MKSRYASKPDAPCPLCGLPWAAGAPISKWLGDWVHEPCKALKMASVASEGVRTVLPEARGSVDLPQQVGVKAVRQAGISRLGQLT